MGLATIALFLSIPVFCVIGGTLITSRKDGDMLAGMLMLCFGSWMFPLGVGLFTVLVFGWSW